MATDWSIDAAINEVIENIIDGSLGLDMDENTKTMVLGIYRPHFTTQRNRSVEWSDYRDSILKLSRKIGLIATTLTTFRWAVDNRRVSNDLDPDAVRVACYWVSKIECGAPPADGDTRNKAGFCNNLECDLTVKAEAADALEAKMCAMAQERVRRLG